MIQKPLLSGKAPEDLSLLRYPVLASAKLDGVRAMIVNGKAVTRKFKAVPNDYIRTWMEANLPEGIDGELLLSDWTAPFREVTSAVMSKKGKPDFRYAVFDWWSNDEPFAKRLQVARDKTYHLPLVMHIPHLEVTNVEELLDAHTEWLQAGFEGTMVRDPKGPYKFGRSTVKEGILLKIKNFVDEEAEVIGVVERMHNNNPLEKDELGHAKRSSAKGGKVGAGTLGALVCRFEDGTEFQVGTGFDDDQRAKLWKAWKAILHNGGGWTVKIKHQPPPGGRSVGEPPRFPVFLGWRKD